ncbi:MAG: VWA domain-containing protein [Acidobacteria bacterium]|nr:VWA domain-containing protein [Acidobacteriota bacterium]
MKHYLKRRQFVLAIFVIVVSSMTGLGSQVFAQSANQQPQDPQQTVLKIPTALVTVPIIVTDRFGRFITGLNRNDFNVREDGVLQKLEDFSSTEEPFNVALLIDTSRSTQNKLGHIRKAALAFIKQLQPNDRVMIVTFDEQVRFVSEFTNNRADLERAVNKLKSSYLTSLYDAIHRTITEKMIPIQGRKAIVVLTDGVDTASKKATFSSSLDLVAATGIISYTIQYETRNDGGPIMKPLYLPGRAPSSSFVSKLVGTTTTRQEQKPQQQTKPESPNKEPNQPFIFIPRPTGSIFGDVSPNGTRQPPTGSEPSTRVNSQIQQPVRDRYLVAADFLRSLAAQSGARYIRAENIENTSFAFQLIAEELRHQYTLTYLSSNEQKDGNYRAIAVRVNSPELVVRARLGYRVPKTEESEEEEKKPTSPSKP